MAFEIPNVGVPIGLVDAAPPRDASAGAGVVHVVEWVSEPCRERAEVEDDAVVCPSAGASRMPVEEQHGVGLVVVGSFEPIVGRSGEHRFGRLEGDAPARPLQRAILSFVTGSELSATWIPASGCSRVPS